MVAEVDAMYAETRGETGLARDVARGARGDGQGRAPSAGARRRRLACAYRNHPLPIGDGQTISQPYIVALSADLLDPKPGDVVLEVGTGSGYQAAVLAELVQQVYTIELIESLGRTARGSASRRLGYRNVEVRIGDGYAGWPEKAPFDGIVVTAAAPQVPPALVDAAQARRPHGDPGGRRAATSSI